MDTKEKITHVDDERGLLEILNERDRVIALFYASWCPYCKKFLPIFENSAEENERDFLLVRDDQESIGAKYSVEIVPTVILFEKGRISKRLDGIPGVGLTEAQLADFIAATGIALRG